MVLAGQETGAGSRQTGLEAVITQGTTMQTLPIGHCSQANVKRFLNVPATQSGLQLTTKVDPAGEVWLAGQTSQVLLGELRYVPAPQVDLQSAKLVAPAGEVVLVGHGVGTTRGHDVVEVQIGGTGHTEPAGQVLQV
jgi:hypothetical protein